MSPVAIMFDILIIAVLVFFAWRGAKKGLILSLCGLVAALVAFFGAQFVSTAFCGPVANIIKPVIEASITETVEDALQQNTAGAATSVDDVPLSKILAAMRETEMFHGLTRVLEEAAQSNALKQGANTAVQAVSEYLSLLVARTVLFGLSYIGILLAWFLASHALDLAFHLPILAEINLAGGLILGLVKAALVIVVLVWLGQLAGIVPAEPETPVLSIFTVDGLKALLSDLPV